MFDHMLVPLDGSPLAECVLPHAALLAPTFDARVSLVRVLECAPDAGQSRAIDPLEWHINKVEVWAYLDGISMHLRDAHVQAENVLLEGQAAQCIIEFIHRHGVNLVLLSSHGRGGLSDWSISSVVQKIILRARTSIMIVPAYQPATAAEQGVRYRRLLVPLDGSQRAECVLPVATVLAQTHAAELILVHVVRRPEMLCQQPLSAEDRDLARRIVERNQEAAACYLERLQARLPGTVHTLLQISDDVTTTLYTIVDQEHVDLVVLGAHGYSGKTMWPYGSITTSFIAHSSSPLLIVQDVAPTKLAVSRAELAARERGGH